MKNKLELALNSFLASEDCEKAFDKATKASWGGSGYSLELFHDGTYRVLWDNQIGNMYVSPGLIISIPPLSEDEWDEDPDLRFYDNSIELLKNIFDEAMEEGETKS